MPAKPAPIKKAAKKELPEKKVEKAPEPAPEPEPAPVEPEAAPAAVEEAPPAEEAPAETPAEGAAEAPAEVVVEAPPPPPPADSADATEATADPEASTDPAANADPAAETPVAEEPKAPTPPPPPPKEPTSAPLDLFIEDKNDTSVSIIWSGPETVGDSGLDGYLIEVCKDGTEDWKAVNEELHKSTRYAIKNQTTGDKLKIRVVAVNAGGRSAPGALPEAVLVKEVANRPKVRLPRFLRQRYVANVGAKINLTVPFTVSATPLTHPTNTRHTTRHTPDVHLTYT
ncbi:myosin-binding protein H-like isoform X1 [Gadus macrocephalus]|uniref:myosin-binding protein H-like isoform X1 n=1 Tax=Gadus macrocephalus TaxID=80720 RepID=UPI0028CB1EE0|nr:myosin-binding protein H-like isoform X1 [Gadus macrocephalus]